MTLRPPVLMLMLAALACPAAHAQAPDLERAFFTIGDHVLVSFPGRLEVVGGYVDGMPVDHAAPEGVDVLPSDFSLAGRLRVAPSLTLHGTTWPLFTAYQVATDLDLRYELGTGSVDEALDYEPVLAGRGRPPLPRLLQANATAIGPHLGVSFGLTRSSWGLGMLANDGAPREVAKDVSPFGFARHTDRVVRAQVMVFPLGRPDTRSPTGERQEPPLTVAVAADAVVEDDTANWAHGDRTWHAVAGVRGRVAGLRGGLYGVHRVQDHAEGGETEVSVLDLHLRQDLHASDIHIWAELEVALTFGETTYAENALDLGPQDVFAGGGLFQVGTRGGGLGIVLEGGYASGDDNPFDSEQRAFTFDREHRVGLMMFREVLARSTAVAAANIADPAHRASPPRGFQRAATGGAVRGAVYINPRVSYEFLEGLQVMVGYLHATSDGFYTDPFQSGLQGGTSMGTRGVPLTRTFGDELDLGLDYVLELDSLRLRFRGEFAWFDPGDIFASPDDPDPADQIGGWLHGEVRW